MDEEHSSLAEDRLHGRLGKEVSQDSPVTICGMKHSKGVLAHEKSDWPRDPAEVDMSGECGRFELCKCTEDDPLSEFDR